jgi:hypothetical protein
MQDLITKFGWKHFDHPPYSQELAPSDFHMFLLLKTFLCGWQFHNKDVKEAINIWFASQEASFYDAGIHNRGPAMTSAATMVKTISKSSVRYVLQIAI